MGAWLEFALDRGPELWLRSGEHLMLTGVSTGAAVALGIPLGVLAARIPRLRGSVMGAVGILQTIPSLAMLVLLLALFDRIGVLPALVALVLYALLPIVRNTVTALDEVAPEVVQAARGLGMSHRQELLWVRLPLATPVILAGVRTAAVISVGIATLSAFIGAGGLGEFINRGLALADTDLILLGAIPAAVMALIVDFSLAGVQWALTVRRRPVGTVGSGGGESPMRRTLRVLALSTPLVLVALGVASYPTGGPEASGEGVAIGSKNFTEQLVLAEIMAQVVEARTSLEVDRRFNLGGTMITHGALVRGEIDVYPEYTGTALTTILDAEVARDPEAVFDRVRAAYAARFGATWLPPFGLDNTYVVAVRATDAEERGWIRASQLAPHAGGLRAGITAEFAERPDGYGGFRDAYGLEFAQVRNLDPGIMYQAAARGEVDVIFAFATDGRLEAFDLETLEDDRRFFPPYEAAPVVRDEALRSHPQLREALELLAGTLPDSTMRRLNHEIDVLGRSPRAVASAFLRDRGLLVD